MFPEQILDLAYFPTTIDACVERLKELAEHEDWDYHRTAHDHPNPVLKNFVFFTYRRLVEQNKIEVSEDGQALTFNTGLVTPNQEEIFGYFVVNRQSSNRPWRFDSWCKKSDRKLTPFSPLPDIATYFDDPSVLILDQRREIRANIDHIISENKERFPDPFNAMPEFQLQTLLTGALENAKRRAARNYKTAIPQYFGGRVQLLLPLCLSDPAKADLALVINNEGFFYRAATCLPLEWAYNNARQLAKPERDWLQP